MGDASTGQGPTLFIDKVAASLSWVQGFRAWNVGGLGFRGLGLGLS